MSGVATTPGTARGRRVCVRDRGRAVRRGPRSGRDLTRRGRGRLARPDRPGTADTGAHVERLRASLSERLPVSLDPSPYPATERFREPPEPPTCSPTAGKEATRHSSTSPSAVSRASLRTPPPSTAPRLTRSPDFTRVSCSPSADGRHRHTRARPGERSHRSVGAAGRRARDATLVVAHGGSGTTYGTLAAGVPLVIVPLFADQLVNAERVAEAGAAVVVEPDRDAERGMGNLRPQHAPRLRAAIETILADPSYARAASRIADEMAASPSIDNLLAQTHRTTPPARRHSERGARGMRLECSHTAVRDLTCRFDGQRGAFACRAKQHSRGIAAASVPGARRASTGGADGAALEHRPHAVFSACVRDLAPADTSRGARGGLPPVR